MKFLRIQIIFLTIFLAEIYSQDIASFVASIPIDDDYINNRLEKLNLPILHMTENQLVTLVNSKDLSSLQTLGVNYVILENYIPGDKFYYLSSKTIETITSKIVNENVIFKDDNSLIVKNLLIEPVEALQAGLNLYELQIGNTFKSERRIWKTDQFQLGDSLISQITSSINPDSVRYFIQSLQDFQTRFLFADTRDAVAAWIKNQFLQMGFTDVVLDSFLYQGTWQKNVIATLPGIYEPEVYNVVGGHHDSYSSGDPMIFAPGADDNASGTAAVLEIARVIMANNYNPESTIKFITFAAEEYGLWGSKDYAQKALNEGMNIKIMINHDMISHTYYPANQSQVDINRYSGFDYLRDLAFYCIENYSVLVPRNGSLNSSGSDSHSFWQRGFPSVYFEETNFSPFYHSPADTIGNYSMEYCAEVIRASCATLVLNIVMPTMVQNYKLVDAGTGNSLRLTWSPNQSPDFEKYKIYVGTESGVYDTVFTTIDTLFTISNLIEENLYYAGVSVLDQDGYESLIVERSGIPLELPLAPKEFEAKPLWQLVELSWINNSEYDLYGYNIYRSETNGQLGDKLNQNIYIDTLYIDNAASAGKYYYYTVKAVDSLLNESIDNTTLRSRVVSLDQGILIVDETSDGDGTPLNPTDEEVDNYYSELLSHFQSTQYDLIDESEIGLADMGAYSTIIWHGNDISDMTAPFEFKDEIVKYLSFGGNFLYTGYRPSKAFENVVGLNGTFSNGDFIYDYLKVEETKGTIFALFNAAESVTTGYNSVSVDSSKTLISDEFHLKNVEMIKPSLMGNKIYDYGTNFDSTSQQGLLKAQSVGVEYMGTDFKTITLSYPLYYMNNNEAKSLIEFILTNKFDEVMSVDNQVSEMPSSYNLSQNYPNPFNPSTTISYSLVEDGFVKLAVYNMLGEEVAKLVNKQQKAGRYEVNFNATGLASGVYLYRIETANFTTSRKLVFMK